MNEFREQISRTAQVVRERHFSDRDPVLSGAFDRFISALARQMAMDLHTEYGDHTKITIADLSQWHGKANQNITAEKFEAMCSAHGIPQDILIDSAVSGRVYFDEQFSRHLFELFGWAYSDTRI